MPYVREVIEQLFPRGTNPPRVSLAEGGTVDYQTAPTWPPDAFAVAAKLVALSGCYTSSQAIRTKNEEVAIDPFDPAFLVEATAIGRRWADTPNDPSGPPPEVQALWGILIALDLGRVWALDAAPGAWGLAALRLMVIADEACEGAGYITPPWEADEEEPMSELASLVFRAYMREKAVTVARTVPDGPSAGPFTLPFLPASLCRMIWPDDLCVQPKTHVSRVGCTIRSLSHNLALMPPGGEVRTSWEYGVDALASESNRPGPLNLLLVPFPYTVPDGCFERLERSCAEGGGAYEGIHEFDFDVAPSWLTHHGEAITAEAFADFLTSLVRSAEADLQARYPDRAQAARRVHGLVLPELALDRPRARAVAHLLAASTDLEVFITGASIASGPHGRARNIARTAIFLAHTEVHAWEQAKHHGWRIDQSQDGGYGLGLSQQTDIDPIFCEHINVEDRSCAFWLIRSHLSVATLICEDLARLDPVQAAVRAIGPSLVVALLMDGAQVAERWPNQYATVLADDPGSSVLTFTSLGLIRRAQNPDFRRPPHYIALWRQPTGKRLINLGLEANRHGILLELSSRRVTARTLDGRVDRDGATALEYAGHSQVSHPDPPVWL